MKIAMFLGMVGMFLPMASHSHEIGEPESEKVYIEPNQLAFARHEMSVCISGEWVPVNAVFSDADGLYVKPLLHNYPYTRWICPDCTYNNEGRHTTCRRVFDDGSVCGHPRPK